MLVSVSNLLHLLLTLILSKPTDITNVQRRMVNFLHFILHMFVFEWPKHGDIISHMATQAEGNRYSGDALLWMNRRI